MKKSFWCHFRLPRKRKPKPKAELVVYKPPKKHITEPDRWKPPFATKKDAPPLKVENQDLIILNETRGFDLGDIYTELGLNSKEHEQIFTPYNICHSMAEITIDDLAAQVEAKGVVEIHDCCCGAGAILIAASNVAKEKLKKTNFNYQNHILITGQDIDYLVTMMCYIQLSLLGMAGYFKVGNALTDPMTDNDSLENYWFTPMYFFPVWHYRRVWHSIGELLGGEPNAEVHEN